MWLASPPRVLWGWNQGVSCTVFLSRFSGEEFASRPLQVVGRIQFKRVVGQRFLFLLDVTRGPFSAPRSCTFLATWPSPSSKSKLEDLPPITFPHRLKSLWLWRAPFLLGWPWFCPSCQRPALFLKVNWFRTLIIYEKNPSMAVPRWTPHGRTGRTYINTGFL